MGSENRGPTSLFYFFIKIKDIFHCSIIYLFKGKCLVNALRASLVFLSSPQGLVHCEVKSLSPVRLFATPWTVAHQAPLSMGFSRHEYWSGLPFPPPGDLPDPGIRLSSLMRLALAGGFLTTSAA